MADSCGGGLYGVFPLAAGAVPAAGDPRPPGAAASRRAPLPGSGGRGASSPGSRRARGCPVPRAGSTGCGAGAAGSLYTCEPHA